MLKIIFIFSVIHTVISLNVIYEWKYVDYVWPSSDAKEAAINSGSYDYTSNILNDVDRSSDGRLFVAVARDDGVPATLSTVSNQRGAGGPLLEPYPNWEWNDITKCDSIISTYRNFIDKCDNLYVLDNGNAGDEQVCPPKLLIFDLKTNRLIKRVLISKDIATNKYGEGFLITPVVLRESCKSEPVVFMSDNEGHALIIWNGKHEFQRFEDEVFNPQPDAINITINKETVPMEDGVIGMAITSTSEGSYKLWFHPTSSFDLSSADVMQLLGRFEDGQFNTVRDILPTQSIAMASDKAGTLFFGLNSPPQIACYNSRRPLTRDNLVTVAEDSETLQFASGVKVISESDGEELYILTNRYHKYFAGTMNFTEVNMRILKGNVQQLVQGTKCEVDE